MSEKKTEKKMEKVEKIYANISVEKMAGSKVKITGEITAPAFDAARVATLVQYMAAAEVPGFRVGKAPEAMVVKHVGEMKILERAAIATIEDAYGPILDEHNIRAIGQPAISITKIAAGNPLGFTLETAVMPEITLKNYKKLAKDATADMPKAEAIAAMSVEEKEIDAVIDDLRKHVAMDDAMAKADDAMAGTHEHSHGEKAEEGEKTSDAKTDADEPQKAPTLPEVTDEFVKKFGNFADVAAFRKQISENVIEHKKREAMEKRRGAIAEKLIAEAKFDVPDIFIESETDTMVNQFRADVERSGLTFDGYLSSIKKKMEDIRAEWRPSAERRARLELMLKHIARAEEILPDEAEVKKEVDHIMSHHKGADRFTVRMYVENLMKNKLVLEFLESETESKKAKN